MSGRCLENTYFPGSKASIGQPTTDTRQIPRTVQPIYLTCERDAARAGRMSCVATSMHSAASERTEAYGQADEVLLSSRSWGSPLCGGPCGHKDAPGRASYDVPELQEVVLQTRMGSVSGGMRRATAG